MRKSQDEKPFLILGLDICCMAILWGAVSSCTAAVQTKEALYAVRVFLGAAEAAYFPGAVSSPLQFPARGIEESWFLKVS